MTPQLTETLTGAVLHLGIAAFIAWCVVRSLRSEGRSGWWVLPMLFVAWLFKWYIGLPLIVVCLIWLESRKPAKQSTESTTTGRAYRLGERISRLLPRRNRITAPSTPQLCFKENVAWDLKKGFAALAFAAIVCGIGYLTRFEYFKNPAGATVRTNRWTEETDVLYNGGWRVLQTHEQWAIEQWMENHPREIPSEAKPWVYAHAQCADGSKADCTVYLRENETITNPAAKQWVGKYEVCDYIYGYNRCTVSVPQP